MPVGSIPELTTNNVEKGGMPFRMSRALRFWVEIECDLQDLRKADAEEIAAILQAFEQCGDAMRSVNRRGQIIWKATPQMMVRVG